MHGWDFPWNGARCPGEPTPRTTQMEKSCWVRGPGNDTYSSEVASWVCPWQVTKPTYHHLWPQKDPALGLMLCYFCLIILSNFIFEHMVFKWSPQDNEAWHEKRTDMQYTCLLFLAAPCPWTQNPRNPTMWRSAWQVFPMAKEMGEHWQPPEATLSVWTGICFEVKKEGNGIVNSIYDQGILPVIFFLIHVRVSPYLMSLIGSEAFSKMTYNETNAAVG